jgi:hypothetical protein
MKNLYHGFLFEGEIQKKTQVCAVCGQTKDETEFYVIRPQGRPPRLQDKCKECSNAYHRARRTPKKIPLDPNATGRVCTSCGTFKALTEFHINKHCPYGRDPACKECRVNHRREYVLAFPESRRDSNLKSRFGIRITDYNAMDVNQEGKCWICHKELKILAVDHDHVTGAVRGLLCKQCNTMLGLARESFDILANAAAYLYQAQHPKYCNVRAQISFTFEVADAHSS